MLAGIGGSAGGGFALGKIVAAVIFSAVGFVAFVYGKKNVLWRPMALGVLLMAYTYFVSGTLAIYAIGIGLCAALYFWRD